MSNKTFLKSINSVPLRQKITPKQHEFARLVAEEHLTSSDAYRRAYKPNILAKNKSVHEMACRVMTNIKVQSMIRSIQHKREEENRTRSHGRSYTKAAGRFGISDGAQTSCPRRPSIDPMQRNGDVWMPCMLVASWSMRKSARIV